MEELLRKTARLGVKKAKEPWRIKHTLSRALKDIVTACFLRDCPLRKLC